jgi:hypothetical protein
MIPRAAPFRISLAVARFFYTAARLMQCPKEAAFGYYCSMKTIISPGRLFAFGIFGVLTLLLGCVPPRPAAPRARPALPAFDQNKYRADRVKILTPTIATNVNVFDVQFVADYTSDASIRKSADDRVLRLIGESDSLRDMLLLSVHIPSSAHGEDARLRAENILATYRNEGPARIPNLLALVYSRSQTNVFRSPVEASIIAAAKQMITNTYDQITENDYAHDFSIQDTSLPTLVAKIKSNYQHPVSESVDITYSVVGGQQNLTVLAAPDASRRGGRGALGGGSTLGATALRGVFTRDSFKTTGLSYERWHYNSSGITREIVRRESPSTGRAVSTEVITWDGIHYRKSTIEGF